MHWYLTVLRQYAEFSGRARRKEYWMFTLVHWVVVFGVVLVFFGLEWATGSEALVNVGVGVMLVYLLATFVPVLALTSRRLHDTGRSGWWQVIGFIPLVSIIGAPVLLVFCALDGTRGLNAHGLDPKVPAHPGRLDHSNIS